MLLKGCFVVAFIIDAYLMGRGHQFLLGVFGSGDGLTAMITVVVARLRFESIFVRNQTLLHLNVGFGDLHFSNGVWLVSLFLIEMFLRHGFEILLPVSPADFCCVNHIPLP